MSIKPCMSQSDGLFSMELFGTINCRTLLGEHCEKRKFHKGVEPIFELP
jgi:hypothetical protein